jgi:hypothetical protein
MYLFLFQLAIAGSVPSLKTIRTVGLQILDGLRDMHTARKYVFVDMKPDNFMVLKDPGARRGRSEADFFPEDRLYFVDFGLMEKLTSVKTGKRENVQRATLAGNAAFCSLDVHDCSVPAAKDDLEALVRPRVQREWTPVRCRCGAVLSCDVMSCAVLSCAVLCCHVL